jgi:hypothetical protein
MASDGTGTPAPASVPPPAGAPLHPAAPGGRAAMAEFGALIL